MNTKRTLVNRESMTTETAKNYHSLTYGFVVYKTSQWMINRRNFHFFLARTPIIVVYMRNIQSAPSCRWSCYRCSFCCCSCRRIIVAIGNAITMITIIILDAIAVTRITTSILLLSLLTVPFAIYGWYYHCYRHCCDKTVLLLLLFYSWLLLLVLLESMLLLLLVSLTFALLLCLSLLSLWFLWVLSLLLPLLLHLLMLLI